MKTQLLFSPLNIHSDIVSLFQIYYPDAKINITSPNIFSNGTLERIIKKFIKTNNPILSMYNFVYSIESSIMTYLYFCGKLHSGKQICNISIDKKNLTYCIPENFNDKEKIVISSFLKKVEGISLINDKDNDITSLINVLPLCTNISYLMTISMTELYNVLLLSKKSNYLENNQICQSMFDSVSQKYPMLFNDNLLEVFKQGKD